MATSPGAWCSHWRGGSSSRAGLSHNANQTQGLDGSLRKVAESAYGTPLLTILAFGLFLFGLFRILDGTHRRTNDITYS